MRWQLIVQDIGDVQIKQLDLIELVQHGLNVIQVDLEFAPCATEPMKSLRNSIFDQGFVFRN
jgi:hypothetical protein